MARIKLFAAAALALGLTATSAHAQHASDKQMADLADALGKGPITATTGNPDYTQNYLIQFAGSPSIVSVTNPFWGTHDQCMRQGQMDSANYQTNLAIRGVIVRCLKTNP